MTKHNISMTPAECVFEDEGEAPRLDDVIVISGYGTGKTVVQTLAQSDEKQRVRRLREVAAEALTHASAQHSATGESIILRHADGMVESIDMSLVSERMERSRTVGKSTDMSARGMSVGEIYPHTKQSMNAFLDSMAERFPGVEFGRPKGPTPSPIVIAANNKATRRTANKAARKARRNAR